jgi:hypothetical protein
MTRLTRTRRLLAAGILAAAAALPLAQAAHAEPPAPTVPQEIAVPAGNKLYLVGHAVGVQIYRCNAVADGYRWGFVGPRADLYGDDGKLIATHFAGPRWQARDGSVALGASPKSVVVDPTAIPWLRLSAMGTVGPDGDRLAGTTFIQRIATTGGLIPPADECHPGTAGTENEVPYTADYYFWKANGGS